MRALFNYVAVSKLHLTRREFYRMNPGLFFDMVQIKNKSLRTEAEADVWD